MLCKGMVPLGALRNQKVLRRYNIKDVGRFSSVTSVPSVVKNLFEQRKSSEHLSSRTQN